MMVLFGDTQSQGIKTDCMRCASMAIDMRRKMKELQTSGYNQGMKKPLCIRMGINTGFCTVGTFGSSHYMDYTVLGTHVNLASRLESAADAGEILISHETRSLIKDLVMCRDKGEINVKGFSQPIKVYQVVDFRKDLGKNHSYYEENSEGFSMRLNLDKIRNYDKERVVESLQRVVERLKDEIISYATHHLLPCHPIERDIAATITSKGVDIQTASAGIARINTQTARRALLKYVCEDFFYTVLMKILMLPKRYNVGKKGLAEYL
jgi:hypothetical protein